MLLVAVLAVWVVSGLCDPMSEARYSVLQAGRLLEDGRYSEAQATLERDLIYYDRPLTRLYLSYAYLARRDASRAEVQARMAAEQAPAELQPSVQAQIGRVLFYEGRKDEAMEAWQKAVQAAAPYGGTDASPDARSIAWHLAMLYWSRSDWESARYYLNSLVSRDDVYAQSARLKLAQLAAPGDPSTALRLLDEIDHYTQARPTGAAIPDLHVPGVSEGLPQAGIEETSAELRGAIRQAQGASGMAAGEYGRSLFWGNAFLEEGDNELTRYYLGRATTLEPQSADAHARLGLALLASGDTDSARAQLQKAEQLDPQLALARHALVNLYTASKDWTHASAELDALSKLEPDNIELHIERAEYYKARGDYDKAEEEYIAALQLQRTGLARPTTINAPLALALFYIDVRGQACERGLAPAEEALARAPQDPVALDAVGWAFLQCGKAPDAQPLLERAVSAAPTSPRYRYHLARCYASLGRSSDARDQYDRVVDLDPGGYWEGLAIKERSALP